MASGDEDHPTVEAGSNQQAEDEQSNDGQYPQGSENDDSHFVVRCRGLPWSTTQQEIKDFFQDSTLLNDSLESVHVTMTKEGRPSGEAYIELATEGDMEQALRMDRKHMGKRYVEVFKSKHSEMTWVLSHFKFNSEGGSATSEEGPGEHVVRLRGLPFECSPADIIKFFQGLDVRYDGILMTSDYQGRSTGEAYVRFHSRDQAEQALERNKQSIGHRYIEIFRSSNAEASRAAMMGMGGGAGAPGESDGAGPVRDGGGRMGGRFSRGSAGFAARPRPSPYERPTTAYPLGRGYGNSGPLPASRPERSFPGAAREGYEEYGGYFAGYDGGYNRGAEGDTSYARDASRPDFVVRMRGLPFRVTEQDIAEWFSSVVDPVDIEMKFNQQGRPTGEADVFFNCDSDAKRAMTKDRHNMQHRYVELFYNNRPASGGYNTEYNQY